MSLIQIPALTDDNIIILDRSVAFANFILKFMPDVRYENS